MMTFWKIVDILKCRHCERWTFWPWYKQVFPKPVFKILEFWIVQKLFFIHFLEFCQIKKSVKRMLPSFNTVMNSFIKYAATQERSSLAHLSQHIIPFHVIIWLVDQWETKKRNIRSCIEISSQFQWFCLSSACRFGYSSNCRYIVFQNIWMVVETGCTWTSHYNTSKTTIKPAAPDYTAFQT